MQCKCIGLLLDNDGMQCVGVLLDSMLFVGRWLGCGLSWREKAPSFLVGVPEFNYILKSSRFSIFFKNPLFPPEVVYRMEMAGRFF